MKALEVGLNPGPLTHRLLSSRFIRYAMTPPMTFHLFATVTSKNIFIHDLHNLQVDLKDGQWQPVLLPCQVNHMQKKGRNLQSTIWPCGRTDLEWICLRNKCWRKKEKDKKKNKKVNRTNHVWKVKIEKSWKILGENGNIWKMFLYCFFLTPYGWSG